MAKVSIAVGNRRLLKLAKFLEKLPEERFFYGLWVGDDWAGKPDLSCGTTACAMGWATAIPEFRELGLRMRRFKTDTGGFVALRGARFDEYEDDFFDLTAAAAERVFGLDYDETNCLFVPGHNVDSLLSDATAKEVAAHIRKFVKGRAK